MNLPSYYLDNNLELVDGRSHRCVLKINPKVYLKEMRHVFYVSFKPFNQSHFEVNDKVYVALRLTSVRYRIWIYPK